MYSLPDSFDLSTLSPGAGLGVLEYAYLHQFFQEEGMALHLPSRARGSEFYVNMPAEIVDEILSFGVTGAHIDKGPERGWLGLVLQAGDPSQSLNLPFSYTLHDLADLHELKDLATSPQLSVNLLIGVRGNLIFGGRVQGPLDRELGLELLGIATSLLSAHE